MPNSASREAHSITCADCGQPYETSRPNTKFCAICRLLKDLLFLGVRTRECLLCSEKFCPTSRHDLMCGSCDTTPSSLHGEGDCAFCGASQAKTIRRGVAVCLRCARSPKHRRKLIQALAKKVQGRREAVV